MNTQYQKMCLEAKELQKQISPMEEEICRDLSGDPVWTPSYDQLLIYIRFSTKNLTAWRHGDVEEDPLCLMHRISEFSAKHTLGSIKDLKEIFLNFYMTQTFQKSWNFKLEKWEESSNEFKKEFEFLVNKSKS